MFIFGPSGTLGALFSKESLISSKFFNAGGDSATITAMENYLSTNRRAGIKIVVETSGIGLARYEVQTLPAFWMIGSGGRTLARSTGAKDWASNSCKSFIANQILK